MKEQENGVITLSREELFEQVWRTPMRRLATQFGFSDVGLAKVCKKHQIPRPPRGHWVRLQHGKPVRQTPLPEIEDAELSTVIINPQPAEVRDRRQKEREGPALVIPVPQRLANPHPLVERTKKSLLSAKPNENGLVRPRARDSLDVAVSPGSVRRAMRVLDALIKAVEERGGKVRSVAEHHKPRTVVEMDGETVPFSFSEQVKREERELTVAEEQRKKRYPQWHDRPEYRFLPTGRLVLQLDSYRDSERRRFADGKKQRVEDLLPSVTAALVRIVERLKERTRKAEVERQRQVEWERQRAEKLRVIREEEERLDQLMSQVDAWHRSQRVRAFVNDSLQRIESAEGEITEEVRKWAEWATTHADRLDPLIKGVPSILDEKSRLQRLWFL